MELNFDQTVEDVIAFNLFQMAHSPKSRHQSLRWRILVSIVFALFVSGTAWFTYRAFDPLWLGIGMLAGLIFFLVYPWFYRQADAETLRKWLEAGKDDAMFGAQTVVVSQEGLITRDRAGESMTKWAAVQNVAQSEKHLFVYTSSARAIIVPKRAFASEHDLEEFTRLVDKYRQQG